ncbi:MAG: phosphoribosyl-ATP diphosphatase [Pirellulaceae bacterium]|nr:phosphoribosyl-ATP diphosphatase [Pirellulaceae bacterium]
MSDNDLTNEPSGEPVGSSASDVFDRLMNQVHLRAKTLPAGSYTTKLISGGVPAMGAKVTEEAAEVVEAAGTLASAMQTGSSTSTEALAARQHMIYEAGDVLYHLWVLLGSFGVSVDELRSELARREGTSGLEEKRRRKEST